jgi:hypothetical protein
VFTPVGRDGAGLIEVGIRLLKGLRAVGSFPDRELQEAARKQAAVVRARCEAVLSSPVDLERLRNASHWLSEK